MTPKEFWAKHVGSLSAGLFAAGLLGILAVYGGGFSAIGQNVSAPETPAAQVSVPADAQAVPPSEQVPAEEDQAAASNSETEEEDKDPLEQAMADEQAKAAERREAIREQINKDREAAGLPLLPAIAEDSSSQ